MCEGIAKLNFKTGGCSWIENVDVQVLIYQGRFQWEVGGPAAHHVNCRVSYPSHFNRRIRINLKFINNAY